MRYLLGGSAAGATPIAASTEPIYVVGDDGSMALLTASSHDEVADLLLKSLDGQMTADDMERLVDAMPEGGQTVAVVSTPSTATRAQARATVAAAGQRASSTQDVWARKSSGYGSVGTKPKTACTNPAQSHKIETSLLKQTAFGFKQQGATFTDGNTGQRVYENLGIALKCTNTKLTNWKSANIHTTVDHAGCTIILLSRSNERASNCGT